MKLKYISNIVVTLLCMFTLGCDHDEVALEDNRKTFYKPIDPLTEPGALSRMLLIQGTNRDGKMPETNSASDARLVYVQDNASVTADNSLFMPFVFKSETAIQKMYLSVSGADNFWDIPVDAKGSDGYVLNVGIPPNVMNGDFGLQYKLENAGGKIGSLKEMTVEVFPIETACSNTAVHGSDGLSVRSYNFGKTPGTISVIYQTYSVPDRVDIRYGDVWYGVTGLPLNGGTPPIKRCSEVTPLDGFLGTSGRLDIPYDPAKSQRLDVYVSGCLEGGTAWDFQVMCPGSDTPERAWYSDLPDCPCTLEKLRSVLGRTVDPAGEWMLENVASQKYHYGSSHEARWAPGGDSNPGQQCTYDTDGKLITGGIAAGSPDKYSPGTHDAPKYTNVASHIASDVLTWEHLKSCKEYLEGWPANHDGCSGTNVVNGISHIEKLVGNLTCKDVTTLFKNANENANVPPQLKNYLVGKPGSTSPTDAEIIAWLEAWEKKEGCILSLTGICDVIDKALKNMKHKK